MLRKRPPTGTHLPGKPALPTKGKQPTFGGPKNGRPQLPIKGGPSSGRPIILPHPPPGLRGDALPDRRPNVNSYGNVGPEPTRGNTTPRANNLATGKPYGSKPTPPGHGSLPPRRRSPGGAKGGKPNLSRDQARQTLLLAEQRRAL